MYVVASFPDIALKSFILYFPTASDNILEIYHVVFDSLLQGGATPLLLASLYGHKEVAVLLLEHSANVDAQNEVIVMQRELLHE